MEDSGSMKIAICDDKCEDINAMYQLVKEYCDFYAYNAEILLYNDVDHLISEIEDIQCLLLDVLLFNITGIEVARHIFKLNKEIKIIFCSTNPEYSIEAFEVNAYRYLVKPINKSKLFEYLDEIRKYYNEQLISVYDINHRQRKISVFDIAYIDMQGRKSIIHLKNKITITVIRKMKEWLSILENSGFSLCHKGILVNIKFVKSIEDNKVRLKNDEFVYLSRMYKNDFQNVFFDLLGEVL